MSSCLTDLPYCPISLGKLSLTVSGIAVSETKSHATVLSLPEVAGSALAQVSTVYSSDYREKLYWLLL